MRGNNSVVEKTTISQAQLYSQKLIIVLTQCWGGIAAMLGVLRKMYRVSKK
jgi:hypothetical protein